MYQYAGGQVLRKTAFLFPGQGAQHVGMSKDIAMLSAAAEAAFDAADMALGRCIADIAWNGPQEELNRTENTQPCMMAAEVAALRALAEKGIKADGVAGFSLGEWTALCAAGVLAYEQALLLVQARAGYMQEAVPPGEGGMAVILGKTREEAEALCAEVKEGYVAPSNLNCPGQITVAGDAVGIDAFLALAAAGKARAKRLAVSIPSHCRLMAPAAEKLTEAMADVRFADAALPIYMNATGQACMDANDIKRNMIGQLTMPVLFEQTLYNMMDDGFDTFIEIGPGKVTAGLAKKCAKARNKEVRIYSVNSVETLETCIKELGE